MISHGLGELMDLADNMANGLSAYILYSSYSSPLKHTVVVQSEQSSGRQ